MPHIIANLSAILHDFAAECSVEYYDLTPEDEDFLASYEYRMTDGCFAKLHQSPVE